MALMHRRFPSMPVAFVTYGIHTEQGKLFHQHCLKNQDDFHTPIDIRRVLYNDPAVNRKRYKVNHNENGDSVKTQIALLDDPRFYEACVSLMLLIDCDIRNHGLVVRVIPVFCTSGSHRCDTTCKALTNKVLNDG